MPEESWAGFSIKADDPAAGTDIQNKAGGFWRYLEEMGLEPHSGGREHYLLCYILDTLY